MPNPNSLRIVLFQPEIPQNTGNIIRTCSVTGAGLTLVRPLAFRMSDKSLKRAGLDYWSEVSLEYVDDLEGYIEEQSRPFYFLSTKGKQPYTEIPFKGNELLIFGSETSGLPLAIHERYPSHFYTIPMLNNKRSLNLSNSAAIVLYEGLRQLQFNPLKSNHDIPLVK